MKKVPYDVIKKGKKSNQKSYGKKYLNNFTNLFWLLFLFLYDVIRNLFYDNIEALPNYSFDSPYKIYNNLHGNLHLNLLLTTICNILTLVVCLKKNGL